jgi:hypothetical protein
LKTKDIISKSKDKDNIGSAPQKPKGTTSRLSAPKNIVSTDGQARALFTELRRHHGDLIRDFAQIQGQYDGHPPIDPDKLCKLGLDYKANINPGYSRVIINRYLSHLFNLTHGVRWLVNFKLDLRKHEDFAKAKERGLPVSTEQMKWAESMSRNFHRVLKSWDDLDNNLEMLKKDMVLFGRGHARWEDHRDFRFKITSPDFLGLQPGARFSKSSLSKFYLEHTKPLVDLWDEYEDASDSGSFWNKKALAYLLYQLTVTASGEKADTNWERGFLEMTRKIKSKESMVDVLYREEVNLVSVFTKEFDGKFTHTIIHRDITTPNDKPLFFHDRQFDSICHLLHTFPFQPGDRDIASARGLGHKIFSIVNAMSRMDNQLIDSSFWASTIFMKTKAGRNRDGKQYKINVGSITDVGEAELIANPSAVNLNASAQANQYFRSILQLNYNTEGLDIEEKDGQARTLGEVGLLAFKEAGITKPQINFFYSNLDGLWKEVVRKFLSSKGRGPAGKFYNYWVELCEDDGVPEELLDPDLDDVGLDGLPKWLEVSATRATASGSKIADIISVKEMFSLAPFMSEDKRHTFLQRAVSAYDDSSAIDVYFPDEDRPDVLTQGMQKAIMENGLMAVQQEIPVSPNDSHRDETPVHMQKCEEIIQGWITAIDQSTGQSAPDAVIAADDQLRLIYQHTAAHLALLSQSPWDKPLAEDLNLRFANITNMGRKISFDAAAARRAKATEMMAIAEQREQQNSDAQLKREKNMADVQVQREKNMAEVEVKREKAMAEVQVSRESNMSKVQVEAVTKSRKQLVDEAIALRKEERQRRMDSLDNIRRDQQTKVGTSLKRQEVVNNIANQNAATIAKIRRENGQTAQDRSNTRKPRGEE